MYLPRMVIRTISYGRVKIKHKWFYPSNDHKEYDGRLDGRRYAFGLYYTGDKIDNHISLWGSEEMYNDIKAGYGPELVDGAFPWMWWYA